MEETKLKIVGGYEVDDFEEAKVEQHRIIEIRNFTDGEGKTVIGQYPVNGPTEVEPKFIGSFMVGTNVGPVRLNMEFDEGTTLEECFEQFDALAQKTIKNAQEEAQDQSRIVIPGQKKQGSDVIIM